jgi:hypothetical protein
MCFASFLSGAFITVIVVNPPEMKLAKCSYVAGFEGSFILKTFQGLHFLFSGSVSWSIDF